MDRARGWNNGKRVYQGTVLWGGRVDRLSLAVGRRVRAGFVTVPGER
jgi:hypothetical protein